MREPLPLGSCKENNLCLGLILVEVTPFCKEILLLIMLFCSSRTLPKHCWAALLVANLFVSMRVYAQKEPIPATKAPANKTDQVVEVIVDEKGDGRKYAYVEQMPQLPGGGGNAAIIKAIQNRTIYPPEALRKQLQGRVLVNFTVGADGLVHDANIVKGIGGGCDEAVLAAVGQLPRFIIGTQNSRPVSVSFTVPVTFRIASPAPTTPLTDSIGRVYTRVEQMPQLPGGGGIVAISKAIQSQLVYPPYAVQQQIEGIVQVYFVVDSTGAVHSERIVRGIGGGCDTQVLAAVHKLPHFTPGNQYGRPVAVGLTIPIVFRLEGSGTTKGQMLDTLRRVYPLVNEMPHLPNGGGSQAIFQTVQQAVFMPPEVANDTIARKVFVGFIVGPSGVIRDVKIVRSLNASCDAAALAAVRKLPRFVGGKLNGLPASVSFTVPVLFGRLPRKP
jgi:TonB family protein